MSYDLLTPLDNPLLAIPSRPRRYLTNESKNIYPISCTVVKLQDNLQETHPDLSTYETLLGSLQFIAQALKGNAGAAVDLSDVKSNYQKVKGELVFYLPEDHPDIEFMMESRFSARKVIGTTTGKENQIVLEDACHFADNGNHQNTIFGAIPQVFNALNIYDTVHLDFRNIRPQGTENKFGMTASGPVSFMEFYNEFYKVISQDFDIVDFMSLYSQINKTIRKGNGFRNGAITVFLDYTHPAILKYLQRPKKETPWIKKAIYVNHGTLLPEYKKVLETLLSETIKGNLFWSKRRYQDDGTELLANTCLETYIKSRASCNLSGINLGQIPKGDFTSLKKAGREGMTFLCELHGQTALDDGLYLERENDRQVLLHVIGLGNMLSEWGIKYEDLVEGLKTIRLGKLSYASNDAILLAKGFYDLYKEAGEIAKTYQMERAFGLAPTATVSYNHKDIHGYTTAPEISPVCADPDTKITTRGSSAEVQPYQYPPNIETAHFDVSFATYFELACEWQYMMDQDGLAHAISFNQWLPGCTFDQDYFIDWLNSPLWTTYYTLKVDQKAQDKTTIGHAVTESQKLFWTPINESSCEFDELGVPVFCEACDG